MKTYDVWSKFFFFWLNFLLDLFLGLKRKSSSSASSRSSSILSSESELRSRVVTDKFEVLKSTPCTWGISSILNNKNQMNISNFLSFSNFKSCWHVFIFHWRQNERISNLSKLGRNATFRSLLTKPSLVANYLWNKIKIYYVAGDCRFDLEWNEL